MKTVICGGGVIGLLTARELALAGQEVVVIDRSEPGQESSWAGGGIVSPLYPWRYPPAVSALAAHAQTLYPALAEALRQESGIDPEYLACGMLMLDADDERDARVWATEQGREMNILAGDQLTRRFPELAGFGQGIWLPGVANIRNPRLMQALHVSLQRQGVQILPGREACGWRRRGGRITAVETRQGGSIEGERFVITAGAWTAGLTEGLGVRVPVRPVRGQMLLFRAAVAELTKIVLYQGHYVIPRRDGHILCGSTMEETGFDKSTTPEAADKLQRVAERLVPALKGCRPVAHWAGLRPGSPNGIPFIGALPGEDNVWVNAGHFRNGLVLAPASARLLADQLLGRPALVPAGPYRL